MWRSKQGAVGKCIRLGPEHGVPWNQRQNVTVMTTNQILLFSLTRIVDISTSIRTMAIIVRRGRISQDTTNREISKEDITTPMLLRHLLLTSSRVEIIVINGREDKLPRTTHLSISRVAINNNKEEGIITTIAPHRDHTEDSNTTTNNNNIDTLLLRRHLVSRDTLSVLTIRVLPMRGKIIVLRKAMGLLRLR